MFASTLEDLEVQVDAGASFRSAFLVKCQQSSAVQENLSLWYRLEGLCDHFAAELGEELVSVEAYELVDHCLRGVVDQIVEVCGFKAMDGRGGLGEEVWELIMVMVGACVAEVRGLVEVEEGHLMEGEVIDLVSGDEEMGGGELGSDEEMDGYGYHRGGSSSPDVLLEEEFDVMRERELVMEEQWLREQAEEEERVALLMGVVEAEEGERVRALEEDERVAEEVLGGLGMGEVGGVGDVGVGLEEDPIQDSWVEGEELGARGVRQDGVVGLEGDPVEDSWID